MPLDKMPIEQRDEIIHIRVSRKTKDILNEIVDYCNKANYRQNGDAGAALDLSKLIRPILETVSHGNENRSEELLKFLILCKIKDPFGKELNITHSRLLLNEVYK